MLASHTSGLDREPNALEPTVAGLTRELNMGGPEHWEEKAIEGIKTAGWAFEPVTTVYCLLPSSACMTHYSSCCAPIDLIVIQLLLSSYY